MMGITAEEIAGAMLGEEPEVESTQEAQQDEPQLETAEEEVEVTATSENVTESPVDAEEVEETKIPIKAYMEEKRKRQEYEARLNEIEAKVSATKPVEPPTIETLYEQDPQGTTSRINAEIARMQNEDPFGNAEAIERLRDLKIELREQSIISKQSAQSRAQEEQQKFIGEIIKAVPDFPNKVQVLTDFAINEMGMSLTTIQRLSNPALVGNDSAMEFIKHVAKEHSRKEAATTVKAKAVNPKPTSVESPGTGSKQSGESLARIKEEARSSGNWERYLDAVGAI